jgi:hypothetical protein
LRRQRVLLAATYKYAKQKYDDRGELFHISA